MRGRQVHEQIIFFFLSHFQSLAESKESKELLLTEFSRSERISFFLPLIHRAQAVNSFIHSPRQVQDRVRSSVRSSLASSINP